MPKEIIKLKEKIFEIKNELKDSNLYLNDHDRFTYITNELAAIAIDYSKIKKYAG